MSYSIWLKGKLLSIIEEMDRAPWLFARDPPKDFSRVRKWSLSETIRFTISMEGKAVRDELLEYFDYSAGAPTNSSFNQRRAQILPEAFEYVFHEFNRVSYTENLYRGYRLLACDGSDLNIAHNPEDPTTYFQSLPGTKGFNQIHLNALYDLRSRTYVDAVIQPARFENENQAMCDMIDRYHGHPKTVFIADRGYECYNILAHAQEKGLFYLIRIKDISSKGGIASSLVRRLPSAPDCFDESLIIRLTRRQTNVVKAEPDQYRFIPQNTHFDFLDLHSPATYEINTRIVRFPISDDSYECILTNLPQSDFSLEEIRNLYHMRWGIETSFRELKYAIGLTNFHARKLDFIIQEIWARMILYNFCEAITTRTLMRQTKRKRKLTYQLNYTRAIHICRYFFSLHEKAPPDVENLISRELLPVRPGRSDPRKAKRQSAVSFLYRVA